MGDKYLITGATGFIGANLTRRLVQQKKDVSIIVRNKSLGFRLKDISGNLKIYKGNILDSNIYSIVKKIKPDYIFHLATYGVYSNEKNVDVILNTNIRGTINLIEALKHTNFKLFVNTGSCFEYGDKTSAMKESDALSPVSDYGVAKAAATLWCQKEAVINNLPIITLRPFAGYGYYESNERLIASSILSAISNKPIELSSPENARNFTFIEDIVDSYLAACKAKVKPGEIFNVASNRPHTVKEVVDEILKITKSKSQFLWLGDRRQHWKVEYSNWDVDVSKAKRELSWKPKHNLTQGLRKTIDWFNKFLYLYS